MGYLGSSKLITCLPYILRNQKKKVFSVTIWPHIIVVEFVHIQLVITGVLSAKSLHGPKNFTIKNLDFSELGCTKIFEQEMMSFCYSILGYTE